MNTVITINLGGNAYQMDEAGYALLREYLDAAQVSLADNPDRTEIVSDLEAAIGDKCRTSLNAGKTVVEKADVEQILREMGPVEGGTGEHAHTDNAKQETKPPKRFYRMQDGAMVAGVCSGIAAYFNIDVALVRLLFVLFTFLTSGGFILAYFVMAVVVPKAGTSAERAAAYGMPPITAQDIANRAKEGYSNFKSSKEWHRWKHSMKQWKYDHKNNRAQFESRMRAQYAGRRPQRSAPGAAREIFGLLALGFILWFGYHHVPAIHDFLDSVPGYISTTIQWVKAEVN